MHWDIELAVLEYTYFYKNTLLHVQSVFPLIILLTDGCN